MYLCGLSVIGVRNQVLIAQVPEASSKIFLKYPKSHLLSTAQVPPLLAWQLTIRRGDG